MPTFYRKYVSKWIYDSWVYFDTRAYILYRWVFFKELPNTGLQTNEIMCQVKKDGMKHVILKKWNEHENNVKNLIQILFGKYGHHN